MTNGWLLDDYWMIIGELPRNGATHSHHPFIDGIFHEINTMVFDNLEVSMEVPPIAGWFMNGKSDENDLFHGKSHLSLYHGTPEWKKKTFKLHEIHELHWPQHHWPQHALPAVLPAVAASQAVPRFVRDSSCSEKVHSALHSLGVSINRGTRRAGWFISWKIQSINGWSGGTPIHGNHQLYQLVQLTINWT